MPFKAKKYLWATAIALLLLAVVAGYFLHVPARLGQAMLHHENRFLNYALSHLVVQRLPDKATSLQKSLALLGYLHLVINQEGPPKALGETWWLINGVAWCDHSASVFISMLEPLNTKGYVAYLMAADGQSPHSVAYFTPGHHETIPSAILNKEALVGDTLYGLVWRTAEGAVATPWQICNQDCRHWPVNGEAAWQQRYRDPQKVPSLCNLFCQKPKIAQQNLPLEDRGLMERVFYQRIYPLLPKWVAANYLNLALWLLKGNTLTMGAVKKKMGPIEYEYYRARSHQLFLELDEAEKGYSQLIMRHPSTPWAKLAKRNLAKLSYMREFWGSLPRLYKSYAQ